MTKLIFATSLSDTFSREIIRTNNREDCIIITTDAMVNQRLKEMGLSSQMIFSEIEESAEKRDSSFAELCMSGVFGDNTFYKEDLELYKVLAIDRLSFWYGGRNTKNVIDIISYLDWDELLVDFNIQSPYPFALANIAKRSTAVRTLPVRTEEVYDTARFLPFDELIVHKGEGQLLKNAKFPGEIIEKEGDMWKAIEDQPSQELKDGLGVNKPIIGIVFDKAVEHDIRILLNGLVERGDATTNHIALFAADERSRQLISKCLKPYLRVVNIYGNEVARACDVIYACAWNDYLELFNFNLEIVDFAGKNRAEKIAPEGVKIHDTIPVN